MEATRRGAEDDRFYDVGGGWFDAASSGVSSLDLGVKAIVALSLAHERDPNDPQIRAELGWGAEWLRRLMIRYPSSGRVVARADEDGRLRPLGALAGQEQRAFLGEPHWGLVAGYLYARLSELLGDLDLLRRGERFWDDYSEDLAGLETNGATAAMLLSEVALHVALLGPRYLASAERRAEALLAEVGDPSDADRFAAWETPGASLPAAALTCFAMSLPDHPLTPRAKETVGDFLDDRVARARAGPFGLLPHDLPGARQGEVAAGELPMRRAEEAWQALFAYRVTSRAEYLELASNAVNWLLGLNDCDSCFVCGGDATAAGIGGAAAYLMALALS